MNGPLMLEIQLASGMAYPLAGQPDMPKLRSAA
jgi:hypothetical protein